MEWNWVHFICSTATCSLLLDILSQDSWHSLPFAPGTPTKISGPSKVSIERANENLDKSRWKADRLISVAKSDRLQSKRRSIHNNKFGSIVVVDVRWALLFTMQFIAASIGFESAAIGFKSAAIRFEPAIAIDFVVVVVVVIKRHTLDESSPNDDYVSVCALDDR